jgi:hypothetical protein
MNKNIIIKIKDYKTWDTKKFKANKLNLYALLMVMIMLIIIFYTRSAANILLYLIVIIITILGFIEGEAWFHIKKHNFVLVFGLGQTITKKATIKAIAQFLNNLNPANLNALQNRSNQPLGLRTQHIKKKIIIKVLNLLCI